MSNPGQMHTERLPFPKIRGPKLEPFHSTATADIEFIEFIRNDGDMDSKVWTVCIDGRVYALKVFTFQNWRALKATEGAYIMPPRFDPLQRPEPTPQDYIDYLDPFNCECREKHITGALTDFVDWENHPEPLSCSGPFRRWEVHRYEPLRAIVKGYIESSAPFIASQVPQMYADLEELHKLGILVRDIYQGNYLDGKLVGFSVAWTMQHICFERASPAGIKEVRSEEPYKFEKMADHWAFWHGEEIEKPEKLLRWHSDNEEDFGFDPRLYDWQKWEEVDDEE